MVMLHCIVASVGVPGAWTLQRPISWPAEEYSITYTPPTPVGSVARTVKLTVAPAPVTCTGSGENVSPVTTGGRWSSAEWAATPRCVSNPGCCSCELVYTFGP